MPTCGITPVPLRRRRVCWLMVALSFLVPVAGVAAPEMGALVVRVTGSSRAIEDFGQLDLALGRIAIHPAGTVRDKGWMGYAPVAALVDLNDQIGGHTATVLSQKVPAGAYSAIRVDVVSAAGRLRDERRPSLRLSIRPVRVWFGVRPGQVTSIVADFIVRRRGEQGRTLDYEVRIAKAFLDPARAKSSEGLRSPHQDRQGGRPAHGLRNHLDAHGRAE